MYKKIGIIFIKSILTLSLVGLFFWRIYGLFEGYEEKKKDQQISILNHIMPRSFDYLVEVIGGEQEIDKGKIQSFLYYYQKVVKYMPDRHDAIGMRSFCFYQLGQKNKAIQSYQEAIDVNPNFFWYYYNLGVIYLQDQQYQKALNIFQKAINVSPERTLFFVKNSSRIYMPLVVKQMNNVQEELPQILKKDYQTCYIVSKVIEKYLLSGRHLFPWDQLKLKVRLF